MPTVIDEINQLLTDMEDYRKKLIDQRAETMNKMVASSRLILSEFKTRVRDPVLKLIEVTGNKYIAPDMPVSTYTLPRLRYTGPARTFGLPQTVRTYELPSPPVFEYDLDTVDNLFKNMLYTGIRLSFYVVYPRAIGIPGDVEDAMNKYFFVETMELYYYTPYDADVYIDGKPYTIDSKERIVEVNKMLGPVKFHRAYRTKIPVVTFYFVEAKVRLKYVEEDTIIDVDGGIFAFEPPPAIDGYSGEWYASKAKVAAPGLLLIKESGGYDLYRLYPYDYVYALKLAGYIPKILMSISPLAGPAVIAGTALSELVRKSITVG